MRLGSSSTTRMRVIDLFSMERDAAGATEGHGRVTAATRAGSIHLRCITLLRVRGHSLITRAARYVTDTSRLPVNATAGPSCHQQGCWIHSYADSAQPTPASGATPPEVGGDGAASTRRLQGASSVWYYPGIPLPSGSG